MMRRTLVALRRMRLVRDQSGVSAVEFALLAPLMIAFYFGLVEICQGYMADRRATHVASMVGDLSAQADALTYAELDDIFAIGVIIMRPFPTDSLQIRVSSVTRGSDGVARVDWSRAWNTTALEEDAVIETPDGLIEEGQSLVMSESVYDYDSPADYLMPGLTRFTHVFYLRPREIEQVSLTP